MTVATITNKTADFAAGVVSLPFLFPIFDQDDIDVILVDSTTLVETTLVRGTDYSVTLLYDGAGGGTVTLVSAIPTGSTGYVKRVLDETQEIDLKNQGDWFPEQHEEAFDRAVMLIQQLQEQVDRAMLTDNAGTRYDAENLRIGNLADGVASTDAASLGQMQTGDTNTYAAAVAAAFAAMVAWVTNYVTSYFPTAVTVSNPDMLVPSTQTLVAGQTRIFFPVPIYGIILSWRGGVQALNKDYIYTAGNNYVDVVGASPFVGGEICTAYIYTSSTASSAFSQEYAVLPAGDTSVTIPGAAFTSAIVSFNGGIQRPVVDYGHPALTTTITVPAAFPAAVVINVIKLS